MAPRNLRGNVLLGNRVGLQNSKQERFAKLESNFVGVVPVVLVALGNDFELRVASKASGTPRYRLRSISVSQNLVQIENGEFSRG
jgi:hypothetical protein